MSLCSRVTLLAALLAGCASAPNTGDSHVDVEIDSRLQNCKSAFDNQLPSPVVIETCAKLYSKPSCQQAFSPREHTPPAQVAEEIIHACQLAYCPVEAAICSVEKKVDFLDESLDWLALWGELNAVILPSELSGKIDAPEAQLFSTLLLNAVIFGDSK